jgi:hypothetical protein
MSVITSRHDAALAFLPAEYRCVVCGAKHLTPPFVQWMCERDLVICGECCSGLAHGLVADLIQVAAIVKLQRLFPGFTLIRKERQEVDAAAKAQAARYGRDGR